MIVVSVISLFSYVSSSSEVARGCCLFCTKIKTSFDALGLEFGILRFEIGGFDDRTEMLVFVVKILNYYEW